MPQILENFLVQIALMGGFIFVVLICATLFLCWMFRPTISRIIEHILGLPNTKEDEAKSIEIATNEKTGKHTAEHITVNVTNVTINNPENVHIDHRKIDVNDTPIKSQDKPKEVVHIPSEKRHLTPNNNSHNKLVIAFALMALFSLWQIVTNLGNTPESTAVIDETVNPSVNEITQSKNEEEKTEEKSLLPMQSSTEPSDQQTKSDTQNKSPTAYGIRKNLRGRGHSDSGREEPQYVGIIGYAVVGYNDLDYYGKIPIEQPWRIKTYERDKQFWNETEDGLEHKTEVLVKNQELKHDGYDNYSGYLDVTRRSDGRNFYIDVKNFITTPYWNNGDVLSAVKVGKCMAVYRQKSDYYPVNIDNKKVDLPDGTLIIVDSQTGTYGRGRPDNRTHQVSGVFWREDAQKYGGAFFNKDDLQIQY